VPLGHPMANLDDLAQPGLSRSDQTPEGAQNVCLGCGKEDPWGAGLR
jgi:hypothetical protein